MTDSNRSNVDKKSAKGPNRLSRLLDGTYNHFLCYLPEKLGRFTSWLLKVFYSGIRIEEVQMDIIRNLPENAVIVYVNKFKSKFDFLFYYTRYRQKDLPSPVIGLDYSIVIWQPLSRIIQIPLSRVAYFIKNFRLPNAYLSGYIREELLNGRTALLSLVEKGGFHRRFVKAKIDPVQYLIELQLSTDRPIYLVPQMVFFSKDPHRSNPTLIDILFGPESRPGILRRLFTLFKNPGKVFVEVSTPLNLKEFINREENYASGTEHLTLHLRRNLLLQINRHRQSITGPMLKTREELKESILTSDRFQQFMQKHSNSRKIPLQEVRKKSDAYLEEIAAYYSPGLIKIGYYAVRWITNTMFDGLVVNSEDLVHIKSLSQKGPLILIPNHKSHIDYLILSYVMYHNNMPAPHIAAGKNLSFWPLGPLFRRGGAFFIRRQFRGAKLYSRVFIEYLYKLLNDGFNIEFFIEGTRSRTGKLILPKLGLLSMLLDAHKNGACEDLIFVPIYVGYDRVLEESAYLHELEGGQKEQENIWQVVKAHRFLKKRYGKIYIQFHDAFSLNDLYQNMGKKVQDITPKEKNLFCRELGFRVINAINHSTVVTAHGMVACALLNFSKKRFAYGHLKTQVETYMRYLNMIGVKLADTLVIDPEYAIHHAFDAYVQRKFVEVARKGKGDPSEEIEYTVNEGKRASIEYYKNNCVAFFIPAAYTAAVILERDAFQFSATDLHSGYSFLQKFFKNEFPYDVELTSEYFIRKSLKTFIDDAILMPHKTLPDTYKITSAGFRRLHLYSRFLKTYFESYWIVLSFYMRYNKNSLNPKERIKKIESLGHRMFKRNEIERREAMSKVTYQNAVDYFTRHGIKSAEDFEDINRYVESMRPYMKLMQ